MNLFSQLNDDNIKKVDKDAKKVDLSYINEHISFFLNNSKSNPFYNKNVFFTDKLKGNKLLEFQIIGNLGGWATDSEFTIDTDYFIISDTFMDEISLEKENHPVLKMLNDKLFTYSKAEKRIINNYKYNDLIIISEDAFLSHVMKRCNIINDNVTKDLILKLDNKIKA
jgi:hypothetical protein